MLKKFIKIYIEITNVCNLNCTFCPKTNRVPEFMSLDLFKKAVDEAKPLCKKISLHVMGEPTLHPKFNEIIKYAEKENVMIHLTTNGTNIVDKYESLINPIIQKINFSIHSLKNNLKKEEFEKKIDDILEFTKYAQEKRDDLIIIYRILNITDILNKDIIQIIEKSFNLKVEVNNNNKSSKLIKNTYTQYEGLFNWPRDNNKINSNTGYCHGLNTHIGILSNGTVVPCCLDNEGTINLGNIKDNTLIEILDSNKAITIKKGFQERKLIEKMCQKCTYINRLQRNKVKN